MRGARWVAGCIVHARHVHVHVLCCKDGAVFPRPGLARVPHVQHMGTMDESWARASPPSSMAMVGQLGGGSTKHLSGLGSRGLRPRAFEPRSSTGAVRGGSLPGGVTGVGPLWWGAPPGRGEGTSPLAPHVGGTGPSLCSFSVAPGCVVLRVSVLRNRFEYFTPPHLAAVSRFLYWWLPLPRAVTVRVAFYTIFRVLDFSENLDRVRLLLVSIRYIT
jgi:hypothetical protein